MPLAALGETCPRAPRGRGGHGTSATLSPLPRNKGHDVRAGRKRGASRGTKLQDASEQPGSAASPRAAPRHSRGRRAGARAPLHVGVTCAVQHGSRAPGHTPPTFLEGTARMDRARPSACRADGRTGRHAVSSPRPRAERRGQYGSRAHPPRFPGVSGGRRAVDGRERGRAGRADGARPAGWPWAVAEHIAASALSACCAPHLAGDPSTPGAGKAFVGPCEEGPPW